MTDREKLIQLIDYVQDEGIDYTDVIFGNPVQNERLADYLIANGVTFATDKNVGHWIIRSSGRGRETTNWAECSECHVCGSPQWKICPVCEARMVKDND